MGLRATFILIIGSFGVVSSFSACSSFGTAARPGEDAGDSSSSAPDGGLESSTPTIDGGPRDGDSLVDAAFDCHTVIEDSFDARAADGNWKVASSGSNPPVDFSTKEAAFTLPAVNEAYTVLQSPTFRSSSSTVDPTDVFIELDLTLGSLDESGATVAQLPELTDQGNVHIVATRVDGAVPGSASIFLLPNGVAPPPPRSSIAVSIGTKVRLRWTYARNGDDLTVTLQRVGAPEAPLQLSTTSKVVTKSAYLQLGPYSNRGSSNEVRVAYDNVIVRACSRR